MGNGHDHTDGSADCPLIGTVEYVFASWLLLISRAWLMPEGRCFGGCVCNLLRCGIVKFPSCWVVLERIRARCSASNSERSRIIWKMSRRCRAFAARRLRKWMPRCHEGDCPSY